MRMGKYIGTLCVGVCFICAMGASAKETTNPSLYKQTLKLVPAPELPAKAAELVLQAKLVDRKATTVAVVQAAVGLNPAAAPAIVGAIAKAVPEMAATAAATAAKLQPKQGSAIVQAAATAAPSKAGEVTLAVQQNLPSTAPVGAVVQGPSNKPPYVA